MTVWQLAGLWFSLAVYSVAWSRGGRPERLAAGLLILDQMVASLTFYWRLDHHDLAAAAKGCVLLVVFGWMSLKGNRWWPLVTVAALSLILFTYVWRLTDPTLSHFAAASARVGLFYLIDLALLFGVWECWLAGDPPTARAAWARAVQVTQARKAGTHTTFRRRGKSQT